MRKDKPIEAADASAVAAVHVAVTDNTWQCILEYEKLHAKSCPAGPTLARFQGMDGIYSAKAKIMMNLWGMKPFDRHDWYVNRCGKEVKYVIDYYSYETPSGPPGSGETAIDYFIDARPAPTIAGLWDRSRVAFQKWRRGEKIF
jgi:cytochrome c heme-lyase